MATTDVERLVVSLEASITKYERTMGQALGLTTKTFSDIERRQETMKQRLSNGYAGLQRGIVAAFAGAAAIRGATALIDASTRIENSLKVVGLEGESLTKVYDRLFQSAQRNMAPLETLTTLYSRLGLAQKELGVSNEQLLSFTDHVALALRVQGTTADEARGALIQLSQAMGSGIVRAEEFNSIVEGAPSILRATAAGLKEAGGSVASLRKLVIDGKLSSEAFFHAFEAGSVILHDQVANAEMTVSQGFVRLQNVLIDTAGKFDTATNASGRIVGTLTALAAEIERAGQAAENNAPAINRFLDWLSTAGNQMGNSMFAGTAREFEAIASAVDGIAASVDAYGTSITDAELATAAAEQALVNFGANTKGQFGELQPVVDDFIQQLLEGRGTAKSAAEAINEIGKNHDFGTLIGDLGAIVTALFAVRSEAVATAAAVAAAQRGETSVTNIEGQRAEQMLNRPKAVPKPVSLSDYKAPEKPGKGGGGKGSKKSSGEKYADSLAEYERRIEMMNQETELLRNIDPLLKDYGFAKAQLTATQELENAATKAGIALTPERTAQIAALAEGYATATAQAAQLAEQQAKVKETADEMAQAGRTALDSIIDGFLEGKDAGEIFNSVLKDLAKSFIKIGLDSLGSGLNGGGFNIMKIFGFADGGIAANGRPRPLRQFARGGVSNTAAIFGEAGPEAAVPLPDGRRIPVDLRMPPIPQAPAASVGGGQVEVSVSVGVDESGNLVPLVTRVSGQIAGQAVKANNKQLPSLMRDMNQRMG